MKIKRFALHDPIASAKMGECMKYLVLLLAACALTAPASARDDAAPVVQRHVDAYRSKNMSAFLSTFAKDAVVIYGGMEFRGHDQIRKAFSLNFAPNAPKFVILSSGGEGDVVWFESGYVFPSGEEICCAYSQYTVRGGKIVSLSVSGP